MGQPNMMEAMRLQPGVGLTERGRGRHGGDKGGQSEKMTRKEYEELVSGGTPKQTTVQGSSPRDKVGPGLANGGSTHASARDLPRPELAEVEGSIAPPSEAGGADAEPKPPPMRVVRAPDIGTELLPHAPTVPRMPPPSYRRVQMKRDALGYGSGTRERAATGTSSRFPGCAAPPPLGATMGHGLASGSQKPDEFFFPATGTGSVGPGGSTQDIEHEANYHTGGSVMSSPSRHGQIVSTNPELARKLFPR